MAKVTANEIIGLGFVKVQFRQSTDDAFETYLEDIIDEEAGKLEGDLGAGVYDSTNTITAARVKRAEKYLVAAELLTRRINIRIGDVTGSGEDFNLAEERKQRDRYLSDAENLLVQLGGSDYSGSVNETSHFEEDEE
jgi:hypothetical protein